MSDTNSIVTQALTLLQQVHDLLAQALPPAVPGMPPGVIAVGPGTIVSAAPAVGMFGPTRAVTFGFVLDAGGSGRSVYTFYNPPAALAIGAHVTLDLLPASKAGDYDTLYQVTSADVAPVSAS